MLTVSGIHVYYDAIHALKGVSFSIEKGELVTLLGANGAGKTTTLKTRSGLLRPRRGTIDLEGTSLEKTDPHEIVRRGVAHVPEGRKVFPRFTTLENLHIGGFSRAKAALGPELEFVFAMFPRLKERFNQQAGTLSGGEQQMLVIGRALMAKPKLLLLDEPSLGIAPKLVQDIARSIVAINADEKVSVLLVEQNSRMALRISRRAYALSTGSVALTGNSVELLRDERVKKLYLGGEL